LASALLVLGALVPFLSAEATVVLEHGSGDTPGEVSGLVLENTRVYGDTALSLLSRAAQT
jgi:hypothetical protein